MCNRYRLTAKQAEVAATFGIRTPYEIDGTFPTGDIFPTGKKTPFYGAVVVQEGDDRRMERMEWGVPTQVPSKRDPATKLTKYVTNVRNLSSSFWRSMLTTPTRRCLVPVSSFSEFGSKPGEDGKKPLHWFDVPSRPVFAFAGIWRPTDRGNAYGFLTTEPNTIVSPIHPKAMPVVLHDTDYDTWLTSDWARASNLVASFPSQLMRLL
ncbi:SOS response-associated peptidase family protein (plasmid) [Sphingomonas sp. gentR]|uniref:SOS response-associated peptidase n=1 Tax=Sphingomonas sp. gentR TaxID=3118768 RepID=UPI0030CD3940